MKKLCFVAFAVALTLIATSCKKEDPGMLTVTPTSQAFNRNGGTFVITVTANKSWTAYISDQTVVNIDKGTGTGDADINVTAFPNAGDASLTSTITITLSDGTSQSIQVSVSGLDTGSYSYLQKKSAKRGVAYSWPNVADVNILGPATSWCYNWANSSTNGGINSAMSSNGITYFPMAWNGNYDKDKIRNWITSHPECDHILAFNEPNLTDQANMTPEQAAALWPELKALADELGVKLTSPAMNWGTKAGYSDPIKWLDEFLEQPGVSIEDFDVIAIHIYMNSVSAVMSDINRYSKYGKKIWLTEFCSWDGTSSSAAQVKFMSQVFNAIEQSDMVERYAWFTVRWGKPTEASPYMQLLTKDTPTALTDRGLAYLYLSTFDKNVVYPMDKRIPACQYRTCSVDASTYYSVPVAISTDPNGGVLQLDGLSSGTSVDYKVMLSGSANTVFQMRYASGRENKLDLYTVDEGSGAETLITTFSIPSTGGATNWSTFESSVSIPAGEKVIRLRPSTGLIRSNWIKFENRE